MADARRDPTIGAILSLPPSERTDRQAWAVAGAHTGYAAAVAMKWARRGVDPLDLVQEALIVLYRNARDYDPARGVPFTKYAAPWVRSRVSRAAHREYRATAYLPVRGWDVAAPEPEVVPRDEVARVLGRVAELGERERLVLAGYFGDPEKSPDEISREVGLSTRQIRRIKESAILKLSATLDEANRP
jgi:RNA polymerase sigma factor (sigma-70 family)